MRRVLVAAMACVPLALSGAPALAMDTTPPLARHAMVAAANPLAVQAGLKVLKAGGTAIDAAIATQAVLGLVEPQSSGLGGGAFMVYYDARTHTTIAYDGRETAPAGASPEMFLGEDGRPLPRATGAISSATPNSWRTTASRSARAWPA